MDPSNMALKGLELVLKQLDSLLLWKEQDLLIKIELME